MHCPHCASAYRGIGNFSCAGCCARLVMTARPSRQHQEAMLEACQWLPTAPAREAILAQLQTLENAA